MNGDEEWFTYFTEAELDLILRHICKLEDVIVRDVPESLITELVDTAMSYQLMCVGCEIPKTIRHLGHFIVLAFFLVRLAFFL